MPLHWYDEYDHIGYDRSGAKVMKRADGSGNGIDQALAARDDPNYARTVYDAYNDREVRRKISRGMSERDVGREEGGEGGGEYISRVQESAHAYAW